MKDTTTLMIQYENDELTEQEEIMLFQELIDTGEVWKLQGSYGRAARDLIEQGLCVERI